MRDTSSRVEAGPTGPLRFDPVGLATAFGSHPLPLRHNLAGAPGFTVADIVTLAGQVAAPTMEGTRARVPLVTPSGVPPSGMDLVELAHTIESADGRLGLLFLQRIPRYDQVLQACLHQVLAAIGTPQGPPSRDETSVFLAAPGATIPVHFDSHHNVLLQLAGTKAVTVGVFESRRAQAEALEAGCRSGKRMGRAVPSVTAQFRLGAGDGLYIPPYAFHWVHGGPEVSAALSCSFSTAVTMRAEAVYACNAQLRRFGLRPRPPGRSVQRDRIKVAALRAAQRARPGRR